MTGLLDLKEPTMRTPAKRAAVYLFTADDIEARRLRRALEQTAGERDWQITCAFRDTDGRRPELRRLQAAVLAGELDVVMLADLTDLAASILAVVETAAWLHERVYIYALKPAGTETHDVRGRARFELLAHLAEWQADIRRERQRSSKRKRPAGGPRRKPPA
jgi:DNA invertase Pin-like site-specific DNA recombinase